MTCPKCHAPMRTVNKQGVHLEQCENCRGIFLDYGELEQLLQAEWQYYGAATPPYQPPGGGHRGHPDSPRPYRRDYPDSPRPYRGHHPDSPRPYRHRGRGSFLGDLFG